MELLRGLQKKNSAEEHSTQQERKASRRLSWLVVLVVVVLLGGLWLFVWQQVNYDYGRTMEETTHSMISSTKVLEEHVRRVVADADRDLLNLTLIYEREGSGPIMDTLVEIVGKDQTRVQASVINERGIQVASFIKGALGSDISDREHFRFHRGSAANTLRIGQTLMGRTDRQHTIPMSRRINKPDGSFGGISYIGLRANYFLSFYETMDAGRDEVISLIGTDGIIRTDIVGGNLEVGKDIRCGFLGKTILSGLPTGTYVAEASADGMKRLVSFSAMPDYPLIVAVGISVEAALKDYEGRKRGYFLGASLSSVLILAFGGLLISRAERQRRHNMELAKALHELQMAGATVTEQAQLLDFAHDYIMVKDLDSRIIYWNRGAESGYGWSASEAKGQVTNTLLKTQFPVPVEDIMASLLTTGNWEGELTHTRKDGKPIAVQSHQTLSKDAAGNLMSILEINHDISEKKTMEVELLRLDRLNTVGEMAASIGHEIRNPLTTVRGYLQLYQRKSEKAEHFKVMIEELDRANFIISEFLSLAKNKAVKLEPYSLNDIISALLPLLQADALLTGHDIQVDMGDVPDIDLDEKEIRQLLLNLARNGIEAMRSGGTLKIKTCVEGDKVVLAVRDTGTGITPELMSEIGKPFLTTKEGGTGLGLATCYRIAERHGAKIDVKTSPRGSAFFVKFRRD